MGIGKKCPQKTCGQTPCLCQFLHEFGQLHLEKTTPVPHQYFLHEWMGFLNNTFEKHLYFAADGSIHCSGLRLIIPMKSPSATRKTGASAARKSAPATKICKRANETFEASQLWSIDTVWVAKVRALGQAKNHTVPLKGRHHREVPPSEKYGNCESFGLEVRSPWQEIALS